MKEESNLLIQTKKEISSEKPSSFNPKTIIAVVALILVVFIWVAMAELLKDLENNLHYHKPFFMSYYIHSLYIVFLGVAGIIRFIQWKKNKALYGWAAQKRRYIRILWASGILSVVFMASILTWYVSLPMIPVSANTAIYNSQCAAVFVFSIFMLKEKINVWKILAVLLCVGGVVLVALSGDSSGTKSKNFNAFGYVFVAVSMLTWALYEVLYKKFIENPEDHSTESLNKSSSSGEVASESEETDSEKEDDQDSSNEEDSNEEESSESESGEETSELTEHMSEKEHTLNELVEAMSVIGLIGFYTLFFMWIGIPIGNATGLEKFELPNSAQLSLLSINAVLDAFFNVFLLVAISFSSPLLVSVVSLLTIPVSVVADKLFHNFMMHPMGLGGVGLIIFGFFVLTFSGWYLQRKKQKELETLNEKTLLLSK